MLATIIACCMLAAMARSAPPASDDESPTTAPGLVATYSLAQRSRGRSTRRSRSLFLTHSSPRYESAPTFLLSAGESPDPRLPAAGWNVQWDGLLRVMRPGKYRFSAIHSGRLLITVAGHNVLDEPASREQPAEGPEVNLAFGQSHSRSFSFRKSREPN